MGGGRRAASGGRRAVRGERRAVRLARLSPPCTENDDRLRGGTAVSTRHRLAATRHPVLFVRASPSHDDVMLYTAAARAGMTSSIGAFERP